MSDMILLTDTELDLVAGGQNTGVVIASSFSQSNSSSISQTASASNSGAVTAVAVGSDATARATGAQAFNIARVTQENEISVGSSD